MSTTPETVPTVWTVDDETFFRAVADVFAPAFLLGAAVLLGSYDPDFTPMRPTQAAGTVLGQVVPAEHWPLAA
jgi:hypothetical protein